MSEREEQVERDEEGAPARSTLEDESKEAIREAAEAGYTPPPRSESPEAEVPVAEEEEMPEAEEEVPAAEEEEAPLVEEETPEAEEEMPEAEEEPPAEAVPVVDLNTATPQELSRLPGIGLTLAKRIVTYREQEGPFREAAEITRVQGISNTLYETLADQITVGPVAVEEAEAALPSPEEVEVVPVGAGPEVGEAEEEGPYVIPLATEEEQPGAEPLPELEEEAPEPEEEAPEPEAPAPAPPPPPPVRYETVRRGAGWGSVLLVGVLSALAGALLALLVLFLLNGGTLDFQRATSRAIDRAMSPVDGQLADLQSQLDDARQQLAQVGALSQQLNDTQTMLSEAESKITSLGGAVDSLQSDLSSATQGLADVRQTLNGLSDDFTSLAETVTTLDKQVTDVEGRLDDMGQVVTALRETTNRFDTFLVGLRGLLEEAAPTPTPTAAGTRMTPTPTPWVSPTPTATEPTSTPTPTAAEPTSTPTPTAAGATATPASQVTVIPLASPTP